MWFYVAVTLRAHPITTLIAGRVKALREAANLSTAAMSRKLRELGIPWTQAAVFRLEAGQRESVAVHELLGLALVLGTTPLALVTDPRIGRPVPLGAGFDVDPWVVARWARGDGHNAERDPRLVVDYDTWTAFGLVDANGLARFEQAVKQSLPFPQVRRLRGMRRHARAPKPGQMVLL